MTYSSKRVRGLSDEACGTITAHGVAPRDYVLHYEQAGTTWTGDKCGCLDSRCIGYHHEVGQSCPCLPVLIQDVQAASRMDVA